MVDVFTGICLELRDQCLNLYGPNLTSLAVFGSVGRGTPAYQSDVDFLVIAKDLPHGRMARVRQFEEVEKHLSQTIALAKESGIDTRLSPLFRTETEMASGGLIFLDMVEDSKILFDGCGFFQKYLGELKEKLRAMGAVRVWRGSTWYWVLKPDLKNGEVFEI